MTSDATFNNLLLGTDLVFVPRLQHRFERHGEDFFDKLLTEAELAYCNVADARFLQRAAGRIAVKEAVAKALGVGINGLGWDQGVYWKDIEVLSQTQSPPDLKLTGRALEVSEGLGVRAWRISLSHDGDYASATAVGLT